MKKALSILLLSYLLVNLAFSQNSFSYKKADSLFDIGHYAESLNENLKALNANLNSNDCPTLALAHFKIGRSYYYLQNKKAAIEWFRKSNTYAQQCKLDSLIGKNYRNLGAIYCELNLKDSSMHYLNKARPYLINWNRHKELSTLYALFFELRFRNFHDTKGGEAYLDTCSLYSKKENDFNTYAFYLVKRGIFLKETERCSEAISTLKEAKNIYKSIGQIEGQMYSLTCLASAYSLCGYADSSLLAMTYYNDLRDEIFKQKTAENLAKYESLFQTKNKEIENLELKRKNQLLFWFIVLGIIIAVAVSYSIYRIKSMKKEKTFNEMLREQQRIRFLEVIQTQEQERTRIASDLHDGVGHLLSAIKLNLSAITLKNEEDGSILQNLNSAVDAASSEVRQISHQLMPQSLSELGLVASLNELTNRINKSNSITIQLKSEIEHISLSKKSQIVIYRIIQEVINNIIKHAKAKNIFIQISVSKPKLIILIEDDGVFFNTDSINESEGIGWKNIKARIELFNGTYKISSSHDQGTKTEITLLADFEN